MSVPLSGAGEAHAPLISVVVPVYNVADYVDRCLRSIVESDYRNLEIICVNDGSTDASGNRLDLWRQRDDRVQVVTTPNQGLAEARNTGIRRSTGAYVTFIDSDDWVHPRYFSVLLEGLTRHGADISMCGMRRVTSEAGPAATAATDAQWVRLDAAHFSDAHDRGFVWGKLYRREWAQPAFDPAMLRCEDIAYNMRLVFLNPGLSVAATPEPLYYYYYRAGSLMDTSTDEQYRLLFEHFLRCARECAARQDRTLEAIFVGETVKRALIYRYLTMFDPARREPAKELCARGMKLLRATKSLPLRDRAVYTLLLRFPFAYRAFRVVNDPTMLNWERAQRRSRKAAERR